LPQPQPFPKREGSKKEGKSFFLGKGFRIGVKSFFSRLFVLSNPKQRPFTKKQVKKNTKSKILRMFD